MLTFGGTKNGLMYGEAVVVLRPRRWPRDAGFVRKQAAQLPSKMRFVAAQFEALLADELWLRNARHANAMARPAGRTAVREVEGVRCPAEVNAVFARLPGRRSSALQAVSPFYVWDEATRRGALDVLVGHHRGRRRRVRRRRPAGPRLIGAGWARCGWAQCG